MDIILHINEKPFNPRRIWELDFLRGICILMMVFDHFMFDLANLPFWTTNYASIKDDSIFKLTFLAQDYWNSILRMSVRLFILFTFFLISGISCSLSKNNIKRLFKLTIASVILTVVTVSVDLIFDMDVSIYFGILHIMALSLLVYILLQKLTKNKYLLLASGLVLIIIGIVIDFNFIPFEESYSFENVSKLLVGLVNMGADSYGIVPYTGVFLVGAFYGKVLYQSKSSLVPFLDGMWHTPITFIGRNTLWVYLLHQPIILGIVLLVGKFYGLTYF